MKLIKGKLYRIRWDDITCKADWESLQTITKQVKEIKPMENTWYYLGSVGHWRMFSSSKPNDNGDYYDWSAIPKGVILNVKEMK